ncbi:unnamed protein product [Macrosiphum euphorbiae]|uniref:Uncharacterized protein n=1 Tax=Macrosiphum euphorbiae TaxID=13131 RepID=A0AAV0Y860_9HEMI|nr:unnamed protein product [Macrosiphum euphorbiae]
MDKWLKKVEPDTEPTQLILNETEIIDEPEPLLSSFITDSSLVTEQELEVSQPSKTDKKKNLLKESLMKNG